MTHGLKIAFKGDEIIRSLNARIAAKLAAIQYRRDEINGKIHPTGDCVWQVPAEEVEQEIRQIQHRVDTLALFRDRLLPDETYLLGRRALKLAGLMPVLPPPPDIDLTKETRWVTRGVD